MCSAATEGVLGGLFIDILVGYLGRAISNWWRALGSKKWPSAEVIVTADSVESSGYGGTKVEIVYSYRFRKELYTGMHTQPCFGSESEYMQNRFPKGRNFVVRGKPGKPEVSVLRDDDQTDVVLQHFSG
jgi:hypothetical protein